MFEHAILLLILNAMDDPPAIAGGSDLIRLKGRSCEMFSWLFSHGNEVQMKY
jgi:hypothetical protein